MKGYKELCHFNYVEEPMKKERLCEELLGILLNKLITYRFAYSGFKKATRALTFERADNPC